MAETEVRGRILVIDDDAGIRETLSDILGEKGYQVETVGTGVEAEARFGEGRFNLALVDIKLPDIEGTKLIQRLRELAPDAEFIMITGSASLETAVEALRHGAADYVMKPFNMDEVLASVASALEHQRLSLEERAKLSQTTAEKEFYRSLSIMDSLTGLYNHRHFRELLALEMARARRYGRPLSLVMGDIDLFKDYQDKHGHLAGDDTLVQLGQTLRQWCRAVDLVARYGGDELVILMPETSKEAAAQVAERLRQVVKAEGRVTISFGVASFPQDAQDAEQLIARADQALYQAKQGGRNQIRAWDDQGLPGRRP